MLEVIYVTRHGFSPPKHNVDPQSGIYHSSIPSPTGSASDPPLASYGVDQARQLAQHLLTLTPRIERWYSSPWYRCIQTLHEAASLAAVQNYHGASSPAPAIRGEAGLGEWFGRAPFTQPAPAPTHELKRHFALYDDSYVSRVVPAATGESLPQLQARAAAAVDAVIADCDAEGVRAAVLCTHAAVLVAVGRALTGRLPQEVGEGDFRPFCCGVSVFVRTGEAAMGGEGVLGGWDCVVNGDCSFLSGGEERGWHFAGDESFFPPSGDDIESKDLGDMGGVTKDGTAAKRGSRL